MSSVSENCLFQFIARNASLLAVAGSCSFGNTLEINGIFRSMCVFASKYRVIYEGFNFLLKKIKVITSKKF